MPLPQGELERFNESFREFEVAEGFFENSTGDAEHAWWDYCRYTVQFEIAAERGLLGFRNVAPSVPPKACSRVIVFVSKVTLVMGLIFDIVKLRWQRAPIMYASNRKLEAAEPLIHGYGNDVCRIGDPSLDAPSRCRVNGMALAMAIHLFARFVYVPSSVRKEADRRSQMLRQSFNSSVDFSRIIRRKYKESYVTWFFWKCIFCMNGGISKLFIVNTDTHRPVVQLARGMGARVIEIQHGYMGESHFAFSYPELKFPLSSLPNEVWIDRYTDDITYPVPRKVIKCKDSKECLSREEKYVDVLIASAPNREQELLNVLNILKVFPITIVVKLHPKSDDYVQVLSKKYAQFPINFYQDERTFSSLASSSTTFIPINPNSTTVFEARDCGARVVIFNQQGYVVTTMSKDFEFGQANSSDTLLKLLDLQQ